MPSARNLGKWQTSALIDVAFKFSKIRRRLKAAAAELKPQNPITQKGLEQLDAQSIQRIDKLWKQWLTRVQLFLEVSQKNTKDSRMVEKLSRAYMPKFVRQGLPSLLGKTTESLSPDTSRNPAELAISSHDRSTRSRDAFRRNLVDRFGFVGNGAGSSSVDTVKGVRGKCDSAASIRKNDFFLSRAKVMEKFFTAIPR